MPTGGIDIGVGAFLTSIVGETAAAGITDALIGSGIGAGIGGIEGGGKGALRGAEAGGLTGGFAGVGGSLLPGIAGTALGGAAGGALGAEVTGGNPLLGAAEGGIGSGISSAIGGNSLFNGATPGSDPATGTNFGGPGGSSAPAPAGIGSSGGDITAGVDNSALNNFNTQGVGGGSPSTSGATTTTGSTGSGVTDPFTTANTGAGSSAPASSSNVSQTVGTPSVSASSGGAVPSQGELGAFNPSGVTGTSIANAINTASLPNETINTQTMVDQGLNPTPNSTIQNIFGGGNKPLDLSSLGGPSASEPLPGSSPIASASSGVTTASATPPANTISTAYNNPTFSNIASAIGANASPLLAGAGLIGDAAMNHSSLKGEKQISNEAGALAAQGQSLQQYLQTGTLPPGLQGALDTASNDAIASIKSQYAAHGMSGSSAEQDAIAAAKEHATSAGSQMALQLLQTGVSESEGAAALYQSIMNSSLQQDNALGTAIGRFATSAAGGTPTPQLSLGGKPLTVS